jgi:hypothetical protein
MAGQVMDPRRRWVGRPQRRAAVLEGDRLHLTAQPLEVGGRTTIPRLTWHRG